MASGQPHGHSNIMSADIVESIVQECLGSVHVAVIAGRDRTGKSWALQEWTELTNREGAIKVAYVNCKSTAFSHPATVTFSGTVELVTTKGYPTRMLRGADVVILDEPDRCPDFIDTAPQRSAWTSTAPIRQLLVLAVHGDRALNRFDIPEHAIRRYSVAGIPLPLAA